MSKEALRRAIQVALDVEYGFHPPIKAIKLEAYNDDGTYAIFTVNDNKYRFKSEYTKDNKLYVGKGTIKKG